MLIIKYFHKLRPLRTPIFQPKGKLKKKYISKNPLWNFETPSEHQANDLLGDKIRFLFNISFAFSQNTQVHKIKFIFKKRRKPLISPIHTKTVSTIISETFSPSIFFIVDDYRWENEEKKKYESNIIFIKITGDQRAVKCIVPIQPVTFKSRRKIANNERSTSQRWKNIILPRERRGI